MAERPILSLTIATESDLVAARNAASRVAAGVGLGKQDQIRLATAVSEIVRNAIRYAGGGTLSLAAENAPASLIARVEDRGPGIPHLDRVLAGQHQSTSGLGMGIIGARRLVDRFDIASNGDGTRVTMVKLLGPAAPLDARTLSRLGAGALPEEAPSPYEAMRRQNRELLETLAELRSRQEELERLNNELADTNRGVVALYAELDARSEYLRRASEAKMRFLSHLTHEFRTPVSAIISLTQLLLDRMDGELTTEQERQVGFIRKSAETLAELVQDLLDLAKAEAGMMSIRPERFTVDELFAALRAVLKPLLEANPSVAVRFEEADLLLHSDQGKISQILRNFISNALKFTERGEIRIKAWSDDGHGFFAVSDTGIGIAPADLERIFHEFSQIDNPLQAKHKGTGLGLALSRRLADLLGGDIKVESELGKGSTFTLRVPLLLAHAGRAQVPAEAARGARGTKDLRGENAILVVDDDEVARYLLRNILAESPYAVVEAAGGQEALLLARSLRPRAIILDLAMPGQSGYDVFSALRGDPITRDIPVIVYSGQKAELVEHERLAGAAGFVTKDPVPRHILRERIFVAMTRAGLQPTRGPLST